MPLSGGACLLGEVEPVALMGETGVLFAGSAAEGLADDEAGTCLSTGLGTSSKLELSSSASEGDSSLSWYFDAKVAIELACSFIEGCGPRNVLAARGGSNSSTTGSGCSIFAGSGCFFGAEERMADDDGCRETGLELGRISMGSSPS